MAQKAKIGIIGCGNMGSAIAKGISSKYQIFIFDKDASKTKNIAKAKVTKSILSLVNNVDAVILAVKPQDFNVVLREIRKEVKQKLIISIAAGKKAKDIEGKLGRVRVVRVMPNLLIKVGRGITALCKGRFATNKDLNFTRQIFCQLGKTLTLKEKMMDAETAFLGSGPGFHFDLLKRVKKSDWHAFDENEFIPGFAASGEKIGFSKYQAKILAKLMAEGDHILIKESKEPPEVLCLRVTSKGGTTEAGLKELKGDVKLLPKAVGAALKRAKQLSRR